MIQSLPPRTGFSFSRFAVLGLLLLGCFSQAQTAATKIYSDYNGYWTNGSGVTPDNRHNLIGFNSGTTTYSTGINDTRLSTAIGATFTPGNYRALPIASFSGSPAAETYFALGKGVDGNVNGYNVSGVAGLRPLDVLNDGLNGLDIGTGLTNIPSGITTNIPFEVIPGYTVDSAPAIIVSYIAESITSDKFTFTNSSGVPIGNEVSVNGSSFSAVGSYALDLYKLGSGTFATASASTEYPSTNTRLITVISLKLSDFGITSANIANVGGFRIIQGGSNDPAFYAYNAAAFSTGAPIITTQPTSQLVCPGGNATFSVVASGSGLTYQWKKNNVNLTGETASSLTISNVTSASSGAYSVVVTNSSGYVVSQVAYLNAGIIANPENATLCRTASLTLSTGGVGLGTFSYQWYSNDSDSNSTGTLISGATNSTYSAPTATVGTKYYYVIVTHNVPDCPANYTTTTAKVVVDPTSVGGTTSGPANVCVGSTASITVSNYVGTIRWQVSTTSATSGFTNTSTGTGATSATYTSPTLPVGVRYYRAVVISGQCSQAISTVFTVNVSALSSTGTNSANQTICYNNATTVSVTGSNGTLQWQQSPNGSNSWAAVTGGSGATTATYSTPALTATTYYRVISTNGTCNPATSSTIVVTVSNDNTWTGATSTDWNTTSNWSCGTIPNANINAIISTAPRYPILSSGTGTSKDLTIASGASVTVSGTGNLRIAGATNNSGTLTATDGTVSFIGTTAQTIPAFSGNSIKNLTINNTAGVTLANNTDLTGILTLSAGSFTTGNHLTLKSNASHTAMIAPVASGFTVNGDITVERYIPARRAFRFLSSPTTGGTIYSNWQETGNFTQVGQGGFGTDITGAGGATNGFDVSGSNNASLFTFDNPSNTWNAVTSTITGTLTAGIPYRMLVRGDRTVDQTSNSATPTPTTLRTTGTIRTGNVSQADFNPTPNGFSFIGNPYQAPVDMSQVLTGSTGLNQTFYTIWDPLMGDRGAYVSVVFGSPDVVTNGSSAATRFLQPGQAFFAQTAASGTPSLMFTENNKSLSTVTGNVFRLSDTNNAAIRFTLYRTAALDAGQSAADGFVVSFNTSGNNDIDGSDVQKMGNQDENAGMLNSGKNYSYQSMAMPMASDVIALTHNQFRATDYTYQVSVDGLDGVTAYLLDKYTNTSTELVNDGQTAVSFRVDATIPQSIASDRFDLVFGERALGNAENDFASNVMIYPNPSTSGEFFVQLPSDVSGAMKVEVVSVLGQQVYSRLMTATGNTISIAPDQALQSGIYMVRIATQNGIATKKLIIK